MRLNLIIIILTISFLTGCNNSSNSINIEIDNYSLLDSVYAEHDSSDGLHIPTIFVNNIAPSIKDLTVPERKEIFIKILLADIARNNNKILEDRDHIIRINNRISNKKNISEQEQAWLENIYKTYSCKTNNTKDLLMKVDIIPPSMAIAQSIVESGWGTSKFAIEGNSLFGEHYSSKASGKFITANNSDIKLRAFTNIYEAVKSYSLNINKHKAYQMFREMRFEMRKNKRNINSLELVETLVSYSELKDEYIQYLKNIIKHNSLQKLDSLKLENNKTSYFIKIRK